MSAGLDKMTHKDKFMAGYSKKYEEGFNKIDWEKDKDKSNTGKEDNNNGKDN